MTTSGHTILITGGGTGIGFSMAQAFAEAGNTVLACGRREDKLAEAQKRLPALKTIAADVSTEKGRADLASWATSLGVNILINNAGMQRMVDFKHGLRSLEAGDNEVRCNLEAPVYLTAALVPHLMKMKDPAIFNVSSALGFVPIAFMPIYCATKAAVHSFSISLRHQLAPAGIKVFEVIPPTVDTDLDRGARAGRGQTDRGIKPEVVAQEVLKAMGEDRFEIAVGMATNLVNGSKISFDQIFQRMNSIIVLV